MVRVYILDRTPASHPHGLPLLTFSTLKKAKDVARIYLPFALSWIKLEQSDVDRRNGISVWIAGENAHGPPQGRIISLPVDKGP